MKRLYRSTKDAKIAGVCAGIAEYFGIDPTLMRAIYLAVTILLAGIGGVILYLLLWWLLPVKED